MQQPCAEVHGGCDAGFRHEVMPLPFELQMLEVRGALAVALLNT